MPAQAECNSRLRLNRTPRQGDAFTLVEIMIVVAIMGITVLIGVPIVYKTVHKPPMAKALSDIVEVCSHARARAILQGKITDVVFQPRERLLHVAGSAPAQHSSETGAAAAAEPSAPAPMAGVPSASSPGSGLSAQISDRITIQGLFINLKEYTDQDMARVRFYPNGTCDEMTMILRSDQGEQRGVVLEVTTGLAMVLGEADLQRLRNGSL